MTAPFPEFSLVLETGNLALMELDGLFASLETLMNQNEVSARDAKEFVVVDCGDAPPEALAKIRERHPLLRIVHIPEGSTYYDTKMKGVHETTAPVIVFCDSDCRYDPNWLRELLGFLRDNPGAEIVSGETLIETTGPYTFAIASSFVFPPDCRRNEPFKHIAYVLNGTAVRRTLIERHPIPDGLPLYRGNCFVHCDRMMKDGVVIWKAPRARVSHAAVPFGRSLFVRYLAIGHDDLLILNWQLKGRGDEFRPRNAWDGLRLVPLITARRIRLLYRRIRILIHHDRRRLAYLPFALPLIILLLVHFVMSATLTAVAPAAVLRWVKAGASA